MEIKETKLSKEILSEIMWGFKEWIKDSETRREKELIYIGSVRICWEYTTKSVTVYHSYSHILGLRTSKNSINI